MPKSKFFFINKINLTYKNLFYELEENLLAINKEPVNGFMAVAKILVFYFKIKGLKNFKKLQLTIANENDFLQI